MLEIREINCPYCGEVFDASIDLSAGSQNYIEDCYVCCRPIQFVINVDHNGKLIFIDACRDDD